MKQTLLTNTLILFFGCSVFAQTTNDPSGNSSGTTSQQYWSRGGNNSQNGTNNVFGTRWNSDIWIMTNNQFTGRFTQGNILSSVTADFGNGLRILPPPGSSGNLDLFTTGTNGLNETHARFGGSGIISGQRNRFEVMSTSQMGMFYNTTVASGIHRFSRSDQETGRIGTNNFWRIGLNSGDPIFGGIKLPEDWK